MTNEEQNLKDYTEKYTGNNTCIRPDVHSIETVDIGEWDDDNPLNIYTESDAEWKRLFPSLNTDKN